MNNLCVIISQGSTRRFGGGKRDRTDDPLLAKQVLSRLSYTPEERSDGGASRDRTDDLLHAMQALSQLSYNPTT